MFGLRKYVKSLKMEVKMDRANRTSRVNHPMHRGDLAPKNYQKQSFDSNQARRWKIPCKSSSLT